MTCIHSSEEPTAALIADSFEVNFCEHGHGRLAFFRDGEADPFAIAYFGPGAVIDMARLFADAMKVEGHA